MDIFFTPSCSMIWVRLPAVRCAVLLMSGILLEAAFPLHGTDAWMMLAVTAASLCVVSLSGWKRPIHWHRGLNGLYLLSIVLAGFSLAMIQSAGKQLEHERMRWADWVKNETVTVSGDVTRIQLRESDSVVWMHVDSAGFRRDSVTTWLALRTGGRFVIDSVHVDWEEGTSLVASVRLDRIRDSRNPGLFDYGAWMRTNGWRLVGEVLRVESATPAGWGVASIRSGIRATLREQYSAKTAPFVVAFLLGDRTLLSSDVRMSFSRAGLSHIMAVSGLHVGFVLAPVWFLIQRLGMGAAQRVSGFAMLVGVMAGYAVLTGLSISVLRATLMAVLFGAARLFHFPSTPLNILCASAFMLLSVRPSDMLEPGFQLSYAAVFLLLTWMPALTDRVENRVRIPLVRWLITMLSVTLIVQIGMAPLLAGWFGEVSWIAPVSNLVTVPLLSLLMTYSIVLLGVAQVTVVPDWIVLPAEFAYKWILWVPEQVGRDESFAVAVESFPVWAVLCWLSLLSSISPGVDSGRRWRRAGVALLFLFIGSGRWLVAEDDARGLSMTVLDVGQGDAIHIELPDRSHLLIDSGWTMGQVDSGTRILLPYLKSAGVDSIRALFLSHPHADHIGGAQTLLENIPVGKVYGSPSAYVSSITASLDSVLASMEIPLTPLASGDWMDLGNGVGLFVMSPKQGRPSSVNDASLVMKLTYGETSFLVTGDAERDSERVMLTEYGPVLDSDVLKVGHHGSATSTHELFLRAVNPRFAVISVALQNRYGLPDREVYDLMDSVRADVHATSLLGAVTYYSDSRKIRKIPVCKERILETDAVNGCG